MTNEILKHKILKSYEINDDDDVSTERLLAMVADDCNCDILDVVDVLAECCEKEQVEHPLNRLKDEVVKNECNRFDKPLGG